MGDIQVTGLINSQMVVVLVSTKKKGVNTRYSHQVLTGKEPLFPIYGSGYCRVIARHVESEAIPSPPIDVFAQPVPH